jgi:hypothetical protein
MTTFANRQRMQRSERHTALDLVAPPDREPSWADKSVRLYPHCDTGPCAKGTKLCPSPEACQRAEEPAARPPLFAACPRASRAIGIALVLSVCMGIFVLKTS